MFSFLLKNQNLSTSVLNLDALSGKIKQVQDSLLFFMMHTCHVWCLFLKFSLYVLFKILCHSSSILASPTTCWMSYLVFAELKSLVVLYSIYTPPVQLFDLQGTISYVPLLWSARILQRNSGFHSCICLDDWIWQLLILLHPERFQPWSFCTGVWIIWDFVGANQCVQSVV